MSKRSDAAQNIANFILENNLAQVYGGESSKDGKCYVVGFSKARYLDGTVHYYGPKFIRVAYQTQYRALPQRDSRVFTDVQNAKDFLKLAFVDLDFDAALAIPTK